MGKPDDKVEYRIDGGEWKNMRFANEPDPTYISLMQEWDQADSAMEGIRPSSTPTVPSHMWKGRLDETLTPGTHKIEVRATDMFGHHFAGTYT